MIGRRCIARPLAEWKAQEFAFEFQKNSARNGVDRQAPQRGLFILGLHVGTRLAHGGNDLIEGYFVPACPMQGQAGQH